MMQLPWEFLCFLSHVSEEPVTIYRFKDDSYDFNGVVNTKIIFKNSKMQTKMCLF